MTIDNFGFYLQNILIQNSQTGGQQYSDTSPYSIPWINALADFAHPPVMKRRSLKHGHLVVRCTRTWELFACWPSEYPARWFGTSEVKRSHKGMRGNPGKAKWRGRLSTGDLLIKLACFLKQQIMLTVRFLVVLNNAITIFFGVKRCFDNILWC
jgi:hypothetical protein